MYDNIDPEKKLKLLPIEIKLCGKQISNPRVVTVNGELLKDPIDMEIESIVEEDDCSIAITKLKFMTLIKQFQLGINRFEVESGGQTTEIVFQAEMWCWRGVRYKDEVTLSLLQQQLNDLETGIQIVTA